MFVKVFDSMYDGTLGTKGPWEALVTFQQMLIMADKEGEVDKTAEVISRITMIPLEIIQKGIDALLKPDPDSRSMVEGGRRIIPLDPDRSWGWKIVNYQKYRDIASAEDRRAYMRRYMQDQRKQSKQSVNNKSLQELTVASVSNVNLSEAEAFSEAEAKEKEKSIPVPVKKLKRAAPSFDEIWGELKQQPCYQHINFERELGKMQVWRNQPKNKNRKFTYGFLVNWLNKIEPPVDLPGQTGSPCATRLSRDGRLRECGQPGVHQVGSRSLCQSCYSEYQSRRQVAP